MLILLSPAKNVNETRAAGHATTVPRFLDEAEDLVSVARTWSAQDISQIMKVSGALAALNVDRFADWTRTGDCAAGLLFDGDVARELEFGTLDEDAQQSAAVRLRFLSGLYGLLRPSDGVCAYRMEMGRKIPGHPAGTLYEFWDTKISEAIVEDAAAAGAGAIMNLASEEYSKAVKPSALGDLALVSPRFEDMTGGKRRVIGVAAKRARGAMARWVLQTGATDPADIQAFDVGGYAFDPATSEPGRPVFLRG
ncbi:hypothetical protein AL035_11810 [Salipiger aestuarii]|uniref:UPF0246 protein ATI53_102924 n=1 Tax=Salipiger aestuarii TaxID=568098 RepID=A0A327XZF0_9RHOB|nr:YaaA family protein [Salipiger aestuarii]KAB2541524.1 hypothetical protein AL035_11810 [Salipiger aestuarii]RAK14130.1 hypothetical protein ATI53_102924 [Salipiger aestuarii]